VEREASKSSPASRNEGIARKQHQARRPSGGASSGGNGRNIGLGLMAKQGQLSERPEAPDNGAEVPHVALDQNVWKAGEAGEPISTASTSASSSGAAIGGVGRSAIPGQPNHNPLDIDDNGNTKGPVMKALRSRSSRLLMQEPGAELEDEEDLVAASEQDMVEVATTRSPLQRRKSMRSIIELNKSPDRLHQSEDKSTTSTKQSLVMSMTNSVKQRLFAGGNKGSYGGGSNDCVEACSASSPSQLSKEKASSPSSSSSKGLFRRNSQITYADKAQTAIIFDWDDTLFPTSYLIDDLRLNHKKPLKEQRLPRDLYEEVAESLKELEMCVIDLLNLANGRAKVILVTLARSPWVEDSCRAFFPSVGDLIKQLGIKAVYAQQGVSIDYDKKKMMGDEEIERFYAEMKGKAISREVEAFYSQYEGQSWKNIISIGDSDFERLGTMMMTQEYMRRRGLLKGATDEKTFEVTVASNEAFARNSGTVDVNGHVYKVRTKTFKMLDCPTIGELKDEISLVNRWLPKMVDLDDGFDADLSALDDPKLVLQIEAVLSGSVPGKKIAAGRPKQKTKGDAN